jgi:type IV pilus assembly protein PilB
MFLNKQEELLTLLSAEGLITDDIISEIKDEMKSGHGTFDALLVEKRAVNPEDLARLKASVYGLPYENLTEKKIGEEVLNIIPLEVAGNYQLICFDRGEGSISVGIVDPENYKAIEAIDFLANKEGFKARYFQISIASFQKALGQYKNLKTEISTALERRAHEEEEDKGKKTAKKDAGESLEVVKSAPIAKIISVIMLHAVEGRASDIHIEPVFNESRVRYRIDGILHTSLVLPRNIHNSLIARIKVLANMKLDETRVPQDGRIREVISGREIDFRVSTLPLMHEEKVVMRIFDISRGSPKLDELGFMGQGLDFILNGIKKPFGLLLVTGPTGSGKSTTLFSILNLINREGINVCTLEDPIEYNVKGANQSQVHPEVGYTFANGLRSLLRQDPDVIMVGEIRDSETAELAIHASLTGHFVLSTLHTNDALGAIPRLLDMKVEPYLLSSTLSVIVAQRLARKICEFCKVKSELPEQLEAEMRTALATLPPEYLKKILPRINLEKLEVYKGQGCPRCGGTGYAGRVAISEVLDINTQARLAILEKGNMITIEDIKKTQMYASMFVDGVLKAILGLTSIEEAIRIVRD